MTHSQVPEILLGILVLVFGKKLFWLFIGILGFAAGMELGPQFFPGSSDWVIFAAASTLGLFGAVLAVAFQWAAFMLTGFLAGGYLLFYFFPTDYFTTFFIGGIIGILLVTLVLDWTLIVFSSLVGAELVSRSMALTPNDQVATFIVLAAVGVAIQSALFLFIPRDDRKVKREE